MSQGILLLSGEFYNYESPNLNKWDIEDIALGLSNQCRFAGQVPFHYSIAQHSVLVSYCIEDEFALAGLLHDAAEAFLVDVPTPLKLMLPDYKRLEKLHESYVMSRFGLDFPMPPQVHIADRRVFAAEVRDLRSDHVEHYAEYLKDIEPFEWSIDFWEPEDAYDRFMARYKELMAERVVH